jgi:redox-sensitive bicupin YhaK (pirin superfamily)
MAEPSFKMLWSEDLPRHSAEGVEVALIAGKLPGFDTPPEPPPDSYAAAKHAADVMVATISLAAGKSWTLPAHSQSCDAKLHRNVYFHSGAGLSLNGKAVQHAKIKVKLDVDIVLEAGASGPAEVLILQGREIGEPVVQHGPFVGNTQQGVLAISSLPLAAPSLSVCLPRD